MTDNCPNCGSERVVDPEYIRYTCGSVWSDKYEDTLCPETCSIIRELKARIAELEEEKIFSPNHPYVDLVRRLAEVTDDQIGSDRFQMFIQEAKELINGEKGDNNARPETNV